MRNLFIIYLLLFVSSIAWGTRIDDLTVEDSMNLDYCTANTVPYLDASKDVLCSSVTDTELGYLDGVTSLIQTQLDGKVTDGGTFTSGTLVTPQVDVLTMSEESTPSSPSSGNLKLYFKSDGNLYKQNSAGLENQVGGGGSGGSAGKNYFSDPNTETIGNYTAFDDGAVSIPVDGTGGSPSFVSVALKTSGQFWGSSTLEITKASGNAQGEGANWATDITLDEPVTAGENLYLSMRYKTAAGYSTAGENIKLFYYRVGGTTTGPFPLNGIDGLGNYGNQLNHDATGRGQFHSIVQADSSTTAIRIIPMVVDTDTTAYTLEISDIKVDTSAKVYSLASSPATNYTPTYSVGMGTVTHDYATYRRVGEFMFLEGRFTTGTVTTGTANISLPSGHTINVGNNRGAGRWDANVGSTADFSSGAFQLSDGDTVVYMGDSFSTAASSGTILSVGNANVILSSSTAYTWEVIVPITEWAGNSTNVLNSTQMDFQNVKAVYAVSSSSANTSFVSSSFEVVDYDTKILDTHNAVTTGTNWVFTAPIAGFYEITPTAYWASVTNFTQSDIIVRVNGSDQYTSGQVLNNTAKYLTDGTPVIVELSQGDTVDIILRQIDSGAAARSLETSATRFSRINIERKSDYTVIGNAGVPSDDRTATSSTLTPTGSGQFHQMTGNSLELPPGKWEVSGVVGFRGSGTPSYTYMQADWYEANGANNGTTPTAIGTNFTSLGLASTEYELGFDSASVDSHRVSMPTITVRNTTTASIYLVPYTTQTDTADARITAYLHAKRVP